MARKSFNGKNRNRKHTLSNIFENERRLLRANTKIAKLHPDAD